MALYLDHATERIENLGCQQHTPSVDLYFIFYIEANVNVRRDVRDGLVREVMVTQRGLNVVEMFLRAGEFLRNQEVFRFEW